MISGWSENALAFEFHPRHLKCGNRAKNADLDAKLSALSENRNLKAIRATVIELQHILGKNLNSSVGMRHTFLA